MCGLSLERRRRLHVISACCARLFQSWRGKLISVVHRPLMKWFLNLDGPFCFVDVVIVGLNELDGAGSGGDECFKFGCSLIVSDVESGRKAFCREVIEDVCEGGNDGITLC